MLLIILILSCSCHFPIFIIQFPWPLEKWWIKFYCIWNWYIKLLVCADMLLSRQSDVLSTESSYVLQIRHLLVQCKMSVMQRTTKNVNTFKACCGETATQEQEQIRQSAMKQICGIHILKSFNVLSRLMTRNSRAQITFIHIHSRWRHLSYCLISLSSYFP